MTSTKSSGGKTQMSCYVTNLHAINGAITLHSKWFDAMLRMNTAVCDTFICHICVCLTSTKLYWFSFWSLVVETFFEIALISYTEMIAA